MAQENIDQKTPFAVDTSVKQVVQIAVVGLLVGAATWLFGYLIDVYFITPIICTADTSSFICASKISLASNVAGAIGVIIGVVAMVKLSVYRPLLVAIATLASLWSIGSWLQAEDWYVALLLAAVLYMIGYIVFGWIARMTSFTMTLVAIILVIIGCRLATLV